MNQDRFKNVHKIGEGTYGVVYSAYDAERKASVALKKIHIKRFVLIVSHLLRLILNILSLAANPRACLQQRSVR